ncbi:hypothetical protein EDWATA_03620 [Edwardsiella tarda ATCC 23685]|uniref:Uncharacterized protein n=1 Tax=Edwardsiella tarda ATCC 23685 TaxID=500638 RepID=D4FA02_EDWTA|nr:hypothetical protein EDWATA_03620 [Edwardsiella tarda ATCC 23685]
MAERVALRAVADMDHRTILNITTRAHDDAVDVAADDDLWPDADIVTQFDLTDHAAVSIDKDAFT